MAARLKMGGTFKQDTQMVLKGNIFSPVMLDQFIYFFTFLTVAVKWWRILEAD